MKQLHVSNIKEIVMEIVFLICACISILSVALICIFLFSNGIPGIAKIGLKEFLLGTEWKPGSNLFGIFSTIVGSIYVTIGAIIVGVPVGLLMAVFMARFCPKKLYKILKPAISLLAGIPSIVYGFFGLVVLVPIMQSIFGVGKSVLTAGILLGIMILPTIIRTTQESLKTVPQGYREGALGLGAGKWHIIRTIVLPCSIDGIVTGCILAVGRIVGESAALLFTAGAAEVIAGSIAKAYTSNGATLSVLLYLRAFEDGDFASAWGIGAVLLVLVLLIDLAARLAKTKLKQKQ